MVFSRLSCHQCEVKYDSTYVRWRNSLNARVILREVYMRNYDHCNHFISSTLVTFKDFSRCRFICLGLQMAEDSILLLANSTLVPLYTTASLYTYARAL